MAEQPHVVVVGGGFGGLYAARALAGRPVRVTLLDRRNHHLFQPLLYQVATRRRTPQALVFCRTNACTRRQASAEASANSVCLRSKKLCGAPG